VTYYVRVTTRGSPKTGSPRQALNYITDGHDARRDSSYSDAELHYIARMDPGWKTNLEGGRVPLVGFGQLAGELDQEKLAQSFEDACLPYHSLCGTTGYKSLTMTLPKEVSLFAEGHRAEAKAAINAAIDQALARAFAGFRYSAVAAIHTRNQTGEIHYHAHVLVGKFARDIRTDRLLSLNGKAGGNVPGRVRELKAGWHEGIAKEFRERLRLGIEQKTPRGSVTLVLPDGTRLEPLNRDSQRLLEKELCPTFTETSPSGETRSRRFRWSVMDDRIFEIASGARGTSTWDAAAFKEAFPEQARFLARYQARVHTLKTIGYLSAEGAITSAFRVHFAAHHGVLTPELQRLRIDLLDRLANEQSKDNDQAQDREPDGKEQTRDREQAKTKNSQGKRPDVHPTQFWEQVHRYADLRHRIERLGYSRQDVSDIFTRAEAKKPTPETLQLIRAAALRRATQHASPGLATILRAYVTPQRMDVQYIYLVTSGLIQLWKLGDKLALARQIKTAAERDFAAKKSRFARVGLGLRPVFWLVRVAMPREARLIQVAITRCVRLAHRAKLRRAARAEIRKAYDRWHQEFIQKPIAQLKQERSELKHPVQQAQRGRLDAAQARIQLPDRNAATAVYRRGHQALARLASEAKTLSTVSPWVGKEDELVTQVLHHSKGNPTSLSKEEYAAAVRIGRVGNLLESEAARKPRSIPEAFAAQKPDLDRLAARLAAFRLPTPFTRPNLSALTTEQVAAHLARAHQVGLLADGPAWTLKGKAAWTFIEEVGGALGKPIFSRTTTPRSTPAKESAMSQPTRSPDHNYPPTASPSPAPPDRALAHTKRQVVSDREAGKNPAAAQGQQRAVPPAADPRKTVAPQGQPAADLQEHLAREPKLDEKLAGVMQRGYQALVQLGVESGYPMRNLIGQEGQMVAEVLSKSNDNALSPEQYEAAVQAVRAGRVLIAADQAPAIQVPDAFADQRKDIERLSARLHGFGIAITTDKLRQIAPAQARCLIGTARTAGFLDDSPSWAAQPAVAHSLGQEFGRMLERNLAIDRQGGLP